MTLSSYPEFRSHGKKPYTQSNHNAAESAILETLDIIANKNLLEDTICSLVRFTTSKPLAFLKVIIVAPVLVVEREHGVSF